MDNIIEELNRNSRELERINSNGRATSAASEYQAPNGVSRGGTGEEVGGYTVKRIDSTSSDRYKGIVDEVYSELKNRLDNEDDGFTYRILDVGSSLGVAVNGLKNRLNKKLIEDPDEQSFERADIEVHELDPERQAFDYTERHSNKILENPVQAVSQDLPYKDNSFDLTISNAALTPLDEDEIKDSVDEFERVTDTEGAVYVSTCLSEYDNDEPFNPPLQGRADDAQEWNI